MDFNHPAGLACGVVWFCHTSGEATSEGNMISPRVTKGAFHFPTPWFSRRGGTIIPTTRGEANNQRQHHATFNSCVFFTNCSVKAEETLRKEWPLNTNKKIRRFRLLSEFGKLLFLPYLL